MVLINIAQDEVITTFAGQEPKPTDARSVQFSPDGKSAKVTYHDNTTKTFSTCDS